MLRLNVKDFGPIIEGDVVLKPLTIFVGPNNSGKSYLSVLAYALFRSLARPGPFLRRIGGERYIYSEQYLWPATFVVPEFEQDKTLQSSLQSWAKSIIKKPLQRQTQLSIDELPEPIRKAIQDCTNISIQSWIEFYFSREFQRCYGSKISDLVREFPIGESFNIQMSEEQPHWEVNFTSKNNKLHVKKLEFDISNMNITLEMPFRRFVIMAQRKIEMQYLLSSLVEATLAKIFATFLPESYYLPAARSGFLQSHRQLASSVVRISPLVGIEKLDIPRLPAIITDFISNLLTLTKESRKGLYKVGRFLEREVLKGSVDMQEHKVEYPEIYYRPHKRRFPIHRTSSMVSELAPFVLFTKYLVDPRDFLIIEEPESHLHPESQRKLARGIVKMVRLGAKILITTHSDYFVEQLSNFIAMGSIPKEGRIEAGYDMDDYLETEEVGAYLFDMDWEKGGSIVKTLTITPTDGISEEDFARVYEALHRESIYLQRRLPI